MIFVPFTEAEGKLTREMREAGATIIEIARAVSALGRRRDHNLVLRYIEENGIEAPPGLIAANRRERLRVAAYRNAAAKRASAAMPVDASEEEFRRRWFRHIGNRAYPRYAVDHADVPLRTGLSATNYMTTGGVGAYA